MSHHRALAGLLGQAAGDELSDGLSHQPARYAQQTRKLGDA